MSRVYGMPVLLNKLFPEVVDWFSETWVRNKQRQEHKNIPSPDEVAPVRYHSSFSLLQLTSGLVMLALVAKFWRRKS